MRALEQSARLELIDSFRAGDRMSIMWYEAIVTA